jgi:UDP-3-O-[3-hydroxymyristoyl] glucosamine N-acyltransferase
MSTVNEFIPKRLNFAKSRLDLKPQYRPIGGYCAIDDSVEIGEGTVIRNNVTIGPNVKIGKNCFIKSGTVIGEKGFSFGFEKDLTPVEIVHTGGVIIGDNVEIGALCTVVSGTIKPTVLEDYVKLDDHIHVAHNCYIGKKTCLTAGVTLAGGVRIGPKCWIGMHSCVTNKVKIAEGTIVGQGANVMKDTAYADVVVGNPARFLRKR